MKLGVITTIWQRPRLTRLFLRYYKEVLQHCRMDLIAVCSTDEDEAVAWDAGWKVVRHKNTPLTDKHNAGARALMDAGVDAVISIPSDDFFTSGYFDFVESALESGHDFIRLETLYFASLDDGRAMYGCHLYHGAGAVISRSLLEKVNWHPWEPGHDRPTDAYLISRCEQRSEKPLIVEDTLSFGFAGVDFKQKGENFKSFDDLSDGLQHASPAKLEKVMSYFPEIADDILSWNDAPKRKRIKKETRRRFSDAQILDLEKYLSDVSLEQVKNLGTLLSVSKSNGGKIELYWRGDLLKMRRNLTEENFSV